MHQDQLKLLAKKLRLKRISMDKTIAQMAAGGNVSYNTLQGWESNPPKNPKPRMLETISKLYNLRLTDFYSGVAHPSHVAEDSAEYADPYANPSPLNKTRPDADKAGLNPFFEGTGMLTIGDVIQNIMTHGTEEERRRLRVAKSAFMKTALEISDAIDARREIDPQKKTAGGNPPGGI